MRLSAEERAVLERHKVDPEIVRELEEARNARELNKNVVRDIKTSLRSLADESFKDMPVVCLREPHRDLEKHIKEEEATCFLFNLGVIILKSLFL